MRCRKKGWNVITFFTLVYWLVILMRPNSSLTNHHLVKKCSKLIALWIFWVIAISATTEWKWLWCISGNNDFYHMLWYFIRKENFLLNCYGFILMVHFIAKGQVDFRMKVSLWNSCSKELKLKIFWFISDDVSTVKLFFLFLSGFL